MVLSPWAGAKGAVPVGVDVVHFFWLVQRGNRDRLVSISEQPAQDRLEGAASVLTGAGAKTKQPGHARLWSQGGHGVWRSSSVG